MNLVLRHTAGILIFELDGHLDFEIARQVRDAYLQHLNQAQGGMVFNLQKLKFVGSSGIHQFIQFVKGEYQKPTRPALCEASREYIRLLRAYQSMRRPFLLFPTEHDAVQHFLQSQPAPFAVPENRLLKRLRLVSAT